MSYTPTGASIRGGESAVDVEDVACYVIGRWRRKKHRGAGNLRWVAPAPGGRASLDPSRKLAVRDQRRVHRRLEESWRDAVHLHVVRRKLDRQRARQHLEC